MDSVIVSGLICEQNTGETTHDTEDVVVESINSNICLLVRSHRVHMKSDIIQPGKVS